MKKALLISLTLMIVIGLLVSCSSDKQKKGVTRTKNEVTDTVDDTDTNEQTENDKPFGILVTAGENRLMLEQLYPQDFENVITPYLDNLYNYVWYGGGLYTVDDNEYYLLFHKDTNEFYSANWGEYAYEDRSYYEEKYNIKYNAHPLFLVETDFSYLRFSEEYLASLPDVNVSAADEVYDGTQYYVCESDLPNYTKRFQQGSARVVGGNESELYVSAAYDDNGNTEDVIVVFCYENDHLVVDNVVHFVTRSDYESFLSSVSDTLPEITEYKKIDLSVLSEADFQNVIYPYMDEFNTTVNRREAGGFADYDCARAYLNEEAFYNDSDDYVLIVDTPEEYQYVNEQGYVLDIMLTSGSFCRSKYNTFSELYEGLGKWFSTEWFPHDITYGFVEDNGGLYTDWVSHFDLSLLTDTVTYIGKEDGAFYVAGFNCSYDEISPVLIKLGYENDHLVIMEEVAAPESYLYEKLTSADNDISTYSYGKLMLFTYLFDKTYSCISDGGMFGDYYNDYTGGYGSHKTISNDFTTVEQLRDGMLKYFDEKIVDDYISRMSFREGSDGLYCYDVSYPWLFMDYLMYDLGTISCESGYSDNEYIVKVTKRSDFSVSSTLTEREYIFGIKNGNYYLKDVI